MLVLLGIYVFIIGCCIGSFCQVLIDRTISGESLKFNERSHCDYCGHKLGVLDLVPIFSYLFLGGKCRYCKKKLNIKYVVNEIIFGFSFFLISLFYYYKYIISFEMSFLDLIFYIIEGFIIFSTCFCIYKIDFKIQIIPDIVHVIFLILGLFNVIILKNITFIDSLIGFFCISVLLYIIACIKDGSFGGGDIKLFASAGFLLGWKKILVCFLISLFYSMFLIVLNKKNIERQIAFGPGIAVGIVISLFYGMNLINLYLTWVGLI